MSKKDETKIKAASLVISYEPENPRPWKVEDLTKIRNNVARAVTVAGVGAIVARKCKKWLATGKVTA